MFCRRAKSICGAVNLPTLIKRRTSFRQLGTVFASRATADRGRNFRINLLELTRVIELYHYRSGTVRTGQYHVQAGTEDGFAPGM